MGAIFVASLLASSSIHASPRLEETTAHMEHAKTSMRRSSDVSPEHTQIRALIEQEAAKMGLPPDVAEAVVFVESDYNSGAVGRVGELGLMQVRPETAAMLGFRGSLTELMKPDVNIHYGMIYLSQAWHLAGGDLCRALMKYRAGHGEEIITPRSANYCRRARDRLTALNSPFAVLGPRLTSGSRRSTGATVNRPTAARPTRPRDVYAYFKQGTPAASRAFWAVHEARIRAMSKKIESRWRSASR